ncbi:MAG: hypothetical protein AAGH81_19355, partial [Bacteroidota bacterium]
MYDQKALLLCKSEIERKFNHGPSEMWATKDFQDLSDQIHMETEVLLSVSTLKRIWQKVHYNSIPHQTTLDALAKYLKYNSWREFENSKTRKGDKRGMWAGRDLAVKFLIPLLLFIALSYGGLRLLSGKEHSKVDHNPADSMLRSDVVSKGLPNSVVFYYNAKMASSEDLVQLQQDWDPRKRVEINRNDSIVTSLYYKPGFFNAKLVINDSIIKETEVLITSKDWTGIIDDEPAPIYLDPTDFRGDTELRMNESTLREHDLGIGKKRYSTGFYKVGGFPKFSSRDFNLETEFKNLTQDGYNVCKNTRISILFKGGTLSIPFSEKGCSSQLSLFVFDRIFQGKSVDLSNLGVKFEPNPPQKLKLKLKGERLELYLNEKLAFSMDNLKKDLPFLGL